MSIGWKWLTALVLLLSTAIWTSQKWLLRLITPKGIPGIPGYSDCTPIFGDIPKLSASVKKHEGIATFMDQVGRDLGPVAQLRLTAAKTMVVVSDYQECISIMNRPQQFERAELFAGIFRNILPNAQVCQMTNDMWKQHRRLMGPAVTSRSLAMMTPRAVRSVKELVRLFELKRVKANGRAWAMGDDLISMTMDVINGMAFGESWHIIQMAADQVKATEPNLGQLGEAVFETKRPELADITMYLLDSVPVRSIFPDASRFIQRLSPYWRQQKGTIDRYLEGRLAESRGRMKVLGDHAVDLADNTLDMMVAREMAGDSMPDNELMDEILLYIVAGTETTAVTMMWYLKYMTNHPDVQHKLRAHLLERIPEVIERDITYDDVDPAKVPYMEAVVQECLRLSRTASGFLREAIVDTSILGHPIPKSTIISLSSKVNHEDETHPTWGSATNADAIATTASLDAQRLNTKRNVGYWKAGTGKLFDPDRWIKDGKYDPSAGPSVPFSGGQRGCFGKGLAQLELRLVIAHLTLAFFFAPVEDHLNSQDVVEVVTQQPKQSFIRVEKW